MPGSLRTLRSIVATQLAHVMPVIGRVSCFCIDLSFAYFWRIVNLRERLYYLLPGCRIAPLNCDLLSNLVRFDCLHARQLADFALAGMHTMTAANVRNDNC